MAEVVHRNLELMLPELEELERSGIFSPQEIKEIVRRRRGMEYKLQRRPVRREDFLRAITYELNLDRLRKVRKKRLGVTSARRDADYGIQDRVHSLFKRAVKRFKADVRLWLQYIDFCWKSRHHVTLGKILARAIALHPNKPGLWVMAGKFQFEDQNDPSSGRSTMQQGLRSNPSSTHLWLEYFRMELMHVDKMKKRRLMLGLEKSEDEELEKLGAEFFSYKIPSIAFQQAVKAVPNNVQFLVSFIDVYRLFDGTEWRQEEVYYCLRRDYSHLADCWEALARRHWTNIDTTTLTGTEVSSIEEKVEESYREGLGVTTQPSSLWRHYLKWCRERVTENEGTDSTQLRAIKRLLTGYQNCTKLQHMSVDMIEEQVDIYHSVNSQ
jgi:U3 small nucleolar RNA-associated protein 6